MSIPTNVIQWYVGFPILLFISIRGWLSGRKAPNTVTSYLTICSTIFTIAVMVYGIPPLVTSNPAVLSWGVFMGDTLQYVGLFVIWQLVVHTFVPKHSSWRYVLQFLILALTIVCIGNTMYDNLSLPYVAQLIHTAKGTTFHISYSKRFSLLTALDYIALMLLGVYYWQQSRLAKTSAQKWKLIAFSSCFIIFSARLLLLPFLTVESQSLTLPYVLSLGFLTLAIFSAIAFTRDRAARTKPH